MTTEKRRAEKQEVKRIAIERAKTAKNRVIACRFCVSWQKPKKEGERGWCPNGAGPTFGVDKCVTGSGQLPLEPILLISFKPPVLRSTHSGTSWCPLTK